MLKLTSKTQAQIPKISEKKNPSFFLSSKYQKNKNPSRDLRFWTLKALGRGPVGEGGELYSSPPSGKIEITFRSLNIFCSNFEGVQIYGRDVDFRALFVKLEFWEVGGPIL